MLRFFRLALIAGTAVAATATAAIAEIDPLTRQPLVSYVDPAKAQATAIPREIVSFSGTYRPGTIVINTAERRLYYVLPDGKAVRYGVGVGRPGFEWGGTQTITRKAEWPSWTPPSQMLKRRPDLPRFMPGGPENPMGARALYLGSTLYRIHGTTNPHSIGRAASAGCFRMLNEDVIELYRFVPVGTKVQVI